MLTSGTPFLLEGMSYMKSTPERDYARYKTGQLFNPISHGVSDQREAMVSGNYCLYFLNSYYASYLIYLGQVQTVK